MPRELTQAVIEEWVALAPVKFTVRDIWNEVGIESLEGKKHLRIILDRLEKKGIVAPTRDGNFRKIDNELVPMDWQGADPTNIVPLKFPFGLDHHSRIYPKSVIIVAGSKNAGKTAFLYNFIALNMYKFEIDLFNSETGPEQMLERFRPLDVPNPAPFWSWEKYDNFADVIHPDHISVIDYLDVNSEVYLVGAEIDAIFRKLNTGVAIIGLQKPPPTVTYDKQGKKKVYDRDLAYGGGFTAKRAVLYISMGSNRLKIVYVKTPANPKVNPNNMTWTFAMDDDGTHFKDIQRYYGELEEG